MARIKSTGNQRTEVRLARMLRKAGIRGWRRHDRSLPGTPDFAFRRQRVAVFVDGCFWHGCPRCYHAPTTHRAFWARKLDSNRRRDSRVSRQLRRRGWSVIRIREHELVRTVSIPSRLLRALD